MAVDTTKNNRDDLFVIAEYNAENAERIGYSNYSYWRSVFHNFMKKKSAVFMAIVFFILVIFTFVAIRIGPWGLEEGCANEFGAYTHSYSKAKFALPSWWPTAAQVSKDRKLWFGADNLGRDYWVQVWSATQTSIKLAMIVAVGEGILGVILGCIWGYIRALDRFFTELYNIITNVPSVIRLTLVGMFFGRSFFVMATALILFGWLAMARNVRNLVLMYRDREYNLASRCLGTPVGRVLSKNVLPYLVSVIMLRTALSVPGTIALETTLSYLGLGMDASTPTLGGLLRDARSMFLTFPHLLIFPAVIVSVITITFYLVGNAFSDAADPRNHV